MPASQNSPSRCHTSLVCSARNPSPTPMGRLSGGPQSPSRSNSGFPTRRAGTRPWSAAGRGGSIRAPLQDRASRFERWRGFLDVHRSPRRRPHSDPNTEDERSGAPNGSLERCRGGRRSRRVDIAPPGGNSCDYDTFSCPISPAEEGPGTHPTPMGRSRPAARRAACCGTRQEIPPAARGWPHSSRKAEEVLCRGFPTGTERRPGLATIQQLIPGPSHPPPSRHPPNPRIFTSMPSSQAMAHRRHPTHAERAP